MPSKGVELFDSENKRAHQAVDFRFYDKNKFLVDMKEVTKQSLEHHLDDLETKTDLVDDALHYGIKARFYKYLEAMSDLKLVDDLVQTQIDSIHKIKYFEIYPGRRISICQMDLES
jgi:hypothetical protein